MNILITGGSGNIGRNLIPALASPNRVIKVLTRKGTRVSCAGADPVIGDLTDPDSLIEAVKGIQSIIHLAAVTHVRDHRHYWRINASGTGNLIKAAQIAGVRRFIFASTRAIHPRGGAYSESKRAAEEMIRASGIPWIILRIGEVYGNTSGGMIHQLIRMVKKSPLLPVIASKNCRLAPVHIKDVVGAFSRVVSLKTLSNRVYLLAGPEAFSLKELVEKISLYYGLKRVQVPCPLFLTKIGFTLWRSVPWQSQVVPDQLPRLLSPKSADISLAKKDLEFNPIRFIDGLSLWEHETFCGSMTC